MKLRIFLIFCFLTFFGVLYNININHHEYYSVKLEEKTERIVYGESAPRGRILERNGKVLVDNAGVLNIVYHKPVSITIKEELEIASKLSSYVTEINLTETNLKNYYLAIHNNGHDLITEEEWELWEKRKLNNDDIKALKWDRITSEMITYSEEEQKIIEEKIIEALYCQTTIIITYYQNGFLLKTKSKIKKIDSIYKTIYLENHTKLLFNQILKITNG